MKNFTTEECANLAAKLNEAHKLKTSKYIAEMHNNKPCIALTPLYGSPEFIEKHTTRFYYYDTLTYYLIGYSSF